MTLTAILALALALAVTWRLTRFIVTLMLLGALIVVIAIHLSGADPHHAGRRISPRPPGCGCRSAISATARQHHAGSST